MSIGSTLGAARKARGLTVDDLSETTRIRPHLIRAIEADDLAVCGGDVYARGHVRALAKAVGVDPEPLLAPASPPPAGLRAPASDPSLVLRERRSAPGWMTAAAVLFGVVACLAALRLVLPDAGGGTAAAPPPASSAKPSAAPSPQPTTAASTAKQYGQGALSVTFAVTGERCWLAVRDSRGSTRLASTLSQGQTATFRDDRKLSIVVGDVTAVTVTVNGRDVSLRGARGGVKRFVVRASDPLAAFGDSAAGTPVGRWPAT